MYEVIKNVISSKRYNLSDILKKIDTLWVQGDLTDAEKTDLVTMAQGNADVSGSIDVNEKLIELDKRVTALEGISDNIPEYSAGTWYYNGDKVKYEGKTYVCVAPDGVVCTWSPKEYPAYWVEA